MDIRAEALRHLDLAAQAHPGTPGERYHSSTAATLATIYAADINRDHTQSVDRMAEVNRAAIASFDAVTTTSQPDLAAG